MTMRFPVHLLCRFLIRRIDEAEDGAALFIKPVGQELHAIAVLNGQITPMCVGDLASARPLHVMAVQEQGQEVLSFYRSVECHKVGRDTSEVLPHCCGSQGRSQTVALRDPLG
jgi:hypothetical protein